MMDSFRQFLCHVGGESTWLFWKDVERLNLSSDKKVTQKILHHIRMNYLQDGASFPLAQQIKEKVVLSVCVGNQQSLMNTSSPCQLSIFLSTQELAFEELKCYWCKRYCFHCDYKDELGTYYSDIDTRQEMIKTLSSEEGSERMISSSVRLPRIIYDEGQHGADERPERVPHIRLSSCSLPTLKSTSQRKSLSSSVFSRESSKDTQKNNFHALITPSTQSLFPKEANVITQSSSQIKDYQFLPFLSACLRTDFLAGYPFLRHVTNQSAHVVNHLLFWQSVEILLTYDEMKRWRCRKNHSSGRQMKSREGILMFFEVYPIAKSLDQLLSLFVKGRSPYRVGLPQAMSRKELCVLLGKGLGQNQLLVAQDHSAQVYSSYYNNEL